MNIDQRLEATAMNLELLSHDSIKSLESKSLERIAVRLDAREKQ